MINNLYIGKYHKSILTMWESCGSCYFSDSDMRVDRVVFKLLTFYLEKAYNYEANGDIQKFLENPAMRALQELHTEIFVRFAVYSDSYDYSVWDYAAKAKLGTSYEDKIIEVLNEAIEAIKQREGFDVILLNTS